MPSEITMCFVPKSCRYIPLDSGVFRTTNQCCWLWLQCIPIRVNIYLYVDPNRRLPAINSGRILHCLNSWMADV
ncbi:hypothetical protein GJ496_003668 [Pomphorhynchus laevis]|nr:hypothetical protein GJ496_003668 [Pomphorhynchus laevis]